jgi:hypothetical protein
MASLTNKTQVDGMDIYKEKVVYELKTAFFGLFGWNERVVLDRVLESTEILVVTDRVEEVSKVIVTDHMGTKRIFVEELTENKKN